VTHEPLLKQYKASLEKDAEAFLFQVGKFASMRGILVDTYNELIREGGCINIEGLEADEMQELWNEAKRVSAVQEQNYVIEVCKAIHGFGSWIQLNQKSNVHP
jgi:hypothetical protein